MAFSFVGHALHCLDVLLIPGGCHLVGIGRTRSVDERDQSVEVLVLVLVDEREPVALVIGDEVVGAVDPDHTASNRDVGSMYDVQRVVQKPGACARFGIVRPRELSEKLHLCDSCLIVDVHLPAEIPGNRDVVRNTHALHSD